VGSRCGESSTAGGGTEVKLYALIGPSGTGKSHHAAEVAADLGADAILDDGLLVQGGRIVAGRSAKREETMVAAVKRAVLVDSEHAADIRRALDTLRPKGLLILATSENMVGRILKALGLEGEPLRVIRIEDVASPEDMETARQIRRTEGKHVIPAPTFEVRKTFAGYWVDALRFMGRGRERRQVAERSVVRPTYSSLGRFFIADTVVSAIAGYVAAHVGGVHRVLRVQTVSFPEGVVCTLDLSVYTGHFLPAVLEEVQRVVRNEVEHQTALQILGVNVTARRLAQRHGGG